MLCEEYTPCEEVPQKKPLRFTILLLDCWQREYDKRPYRNFSFHLHEFEERLGRKFNPLRDFAVVVEFLQKRSLCMVSLVALRVSEYRSDLIDGFVDSLKNLRSLELKLMELPARFFEKLRDCAAEMRVQDLSLEGTHMTNDDVMALREFIIAAPHLHYLNVARANITQYNFVLIADGVYNSKTVRIFNCSHLLGDRLTLDTMKMAYILATVVGQNKLEELVMEHCEFMSRDLDTIIEYLIRTDSTLLRLNIAYNCLGASGAETLFKTIVASNTLTHLNLTGNKLGNHGGDVVAKYLSSCYRLQFLSLTYNNIGAESINMILLTLKKPIQLQRLELWGNEFNDRTVKTLHRQLDARVVTQNMLDITLGYDSALQACRVVPYL